MPLAQRRAHRRRAAKHPGARRCAEWGGGLRSADPRSLPATASKLGAVAGTSPSIEVAAPPAQCPAARLRLAERQRRGAECRRRLAKRRGGLRRAESWPSGELRSATAPHQAPSRASGSTSRRACASSPAPPKPPKPAILPRGAHPLRPAAHSCSRSTHLRATLQQPEPLPLVLHLYACGSRHATRSCLMRQSRALLK